MRTAVIVVSIVSLLAGQSLAQSPAGAVQMEEAVKAVNTFVPLKVVLTRPCKIYKEPRADADVQRSAGPMTFFFVLPAKPDAPRAKPTTAPDGGGAEVGNKADVEYRIPGPNETYWYRVAPREKISKGNQYGFVNSKDCVEWWHREAMGFSPRQVGNIARKRLRFYDSSANLVDAYTKFPDADDVKDTLKVAMEPETAGNLGFVMPILEKKVAQPFPDGNSPDLYKVAFISVAPGGGGAASATAPAGDAGSNSEEASRAKLAEQLKTFPVEIAFVLDTSGSMAEEINGVRESVKSVAAELAKNHADIAKRFHFGLVAFGTDPLPQVKCSFQAGQDPAVFDRAVGSLQEGGGVDNGEDWLGGVSMAIGKMDWSEVSIKIVVVISDENAFDDTHNPESNTSNMSVAQVRTQAQPTKSALRPLDAAMASKLIYGVESLDMAAPAELTSLRTTQFNDLVHGSAYDGEHIKVQPNDTAAVAKELVARLTKTIDGLRQAIRAIEEPALAAPVQQANQPATGQTPLAASSDAIWKEIPAPFIPIILASRPKTSGQVPTVETAWITEHDGFGVNAVSERFLVNRLRLTRFKNICSDLENELGEPVVNAAALAASLQQKLTGMSVDYDVHPTTSMHDIFEVVSELPVKTPLFDISAEQLENQSPDTRKRFIAKLKTLQAVMQKHLDDPNVWLDLDGSKDANAELSFIDIGDFR